MKTATTLERPKTLTPKAPVMPRPQTDFGERCDNGRRFCWLGISRLTRIPDAGFPSRMSCRQHVTAEEAAAGIDFVARFREAEELERSNNIPATTEKVKQLGRLHLPVIGPPMASDIHQKAIDPRKNRDSAWSWVEMEIDSFLHQQRQGEFSSLKT